MAFSTNEANIHIGCIFATFLIWFLTLVPVRLAQRRAGFDNANPRQQYNNLSGWGSRAVACNNNTFEAFAFFGIAALVHYFGNPSSTAGVVFCILFVVVRGVYPFLYIFDYSSTRSAVWVIGLACIMGLFIDSFL
ncbi:hypothetical protein K7432_005790 [Basidiobolus ranarum]|uniref:MAPEG family protein n=1 Tax=Basidiobolus ranarum TaxID=34480 RepID=A0ABR2W351_9FUNG